MKQFIVYEMFTATSAFDSAPITGEEIVYDADTQEEAIEWVNDQSGNLDRFVIEDSDHFDPDFDDYDNNHTETFQSKKVDNYSRPWEDDEVDLNSEEKLSPDND